MSADSEYVAKKVVYGKLWLSLLSSFDLETGVATNSVMLTSFTWSIMPV